MHIRKTAGVKEIEEMKRKLLDICVKEERHMDGMV